MIMAKGSRKSIFLFQRVRTFAKKKGGLIFNFLGRELEPP